MPDTKNYSDVETRKRADAALKRMLATPPKPHKDSKLGRRREISDQIAKRPDATRRRAARNSAETAILLAELGRRFSRVVIAFAARSE